MTTPVVPQRSVPSRVMTFYHDVMTEMKKVTWPTRTEVVSTTVVVLIATLVFALYLWGADQVFFFLTTKLFSYFGAGA